MSLVVPAVKYKNVKTLSLLTAVGFGGLVFLLLKNRKVILKYLRLTLPVDSPLKYQTIEVINSEDECKHAVQKITQKCQEYRVLGFDCEWVTHGSSRRPVALLQLASHDGYCVLIRLCKMKSVPSELKTLLEDVSILKVGVAPLDDAKYLLTDYAIKVNGILDLRHLATVANQKAEGLSSMAASQLNVKMDKYWRVRCSDWEADLLTERQLKYAATDAQVAVEIFKTLIQKVLDKKYSFNLFCKRKQSPWADIEKVYAHFVDVNYKAKKKSEKKKKRDSTDFEALLSDQQRKSYKLPNFKSGGRYSTPIRLKPLYQNCYMQTNDGEVLCTCDRKKAEWYVEKEIADLVCEEPYTIKLRFEPAGRSVGDVGRYYQSPRENRCVVCGVTESSIKKSVVPKEYRRNFPAVMKDHSSHDVLLLCSDCHQLSNSKDQYMRYKLAELCDAPIYNKEEPKVNQLFDVHKVKSAARALLRDATKPGIPQEKKDELRKKIQEYYPEASEITEELLVSASKLDASLMNPNYEAHGEIVVNYFTQNPGGLLALEQMWREHFLESMHPKYMPEFWSVTHTKARLEIRASEGRVDKKDLLIAGLAANDHFSVDKSSPRSDLTNLDE